MPVEIIEGMKFPEHSRRGAKPKYPWLQLKPGQAFKFAEGVSVASAKSMASQIASGMAWKFAVRKTEDGVFCWRIDGTGWEVPNGNYRQEVAVITDYAANPKEADETAVVGYEPKTAAAVPRSRSQLHVDEVNAARDAAIAAAGEDDVI